MEMYVYSLEDNQHVATITGGSNQVCKKAFMQHYDINDYASTYSPAFGAKDGLTENASACSIVVKFYSGDLNNGDINSFDTYEEAYADYKEMAESCATTDRGDEADATPEEALQESLDFHYVRKETVVRDEDGDAIEEKSEIMDGGVEAPAQYS